MPQLLTCPHGHQWQHEHEAVSWTAEHPLRCPVCGATLTDAPPPASSRVSWDAQTVVLSSPPSAGGSSTQDATLPPSGTAGTKVDISAQTLVATLRTGATVVDPSAPEAPDPTERLEPGAPAASVDVAAQTLAPTAPLNLSATGWSEQLPPVSTPLKPAAQVVIAQTLAPSLPPVGSSVLDTTEQLPGTVTSQTGSVDISAQTLASVVPISATALDRTEPLSSAGSSGTDVIDVTAQTFTGSHPRPATLDVSAETHSPSAPRPALTPTQHETLAGYEILGILGRGGMGVVYKARQEGLNRIVALKTLLAGTHGGTEELIRFRIEAEAVARLQHPNIVQVYEVSERDGQPFLAMEFVSGGALDKKLDGTPQPARQAAELLETLARAMHYAHERGIIHRDLKPANVLLTPELVPKITDFGLAKRLEDDTGQTRTGAIMGTPSYMAPEQAEGKTKELGPAADIYSLGAILYDVLTGRPPFRGETVLDTLEQVRTQDPVRPTRLQPKTPTDLETICLKSLAKEPAKRYASAGAMADDLARYLRGEPIQARPTPAWERAWKWARRRPAVAALIAVSAAAVLGLIVGGFAWATHERRLHNIAEAHRLEALTQKDLAERNFQRAEARYKDARDAVDLMLTRVGQERLVNEPRMEKVRRDLLESALQFYRRFLDEDSKDPAIRWETARASQRVGDIHEMLGEYAKAERVYRSAVASLEALVADQPREAEFRKALAATHNNLAIVFQAAGQRDQAEQAYRAALTIKQQLAQDFPEEPEYRRDLGSSYNNRAILLQTQNQFQDAEEAYRQALELFVQLGKQFEKPAYLLELAKTYTNLGVLLQTTRRPQEANQAYQDAIDIQTQLVQQHPEVPEYRKENGRTYFSRGVFYQLTGQVSEAERAYRRAIDVFFKLSSEFPSVPDYRHELALCYNNLGNLLRASNRAAEAEQAWEEARVRLQRLAEESTYIPVYRKDLASNYNEYGLLLESLNKTKEAEEAWQQAVALQERLVAQFPAETAYRQQLARSHFNLGRLMAKLQRFEPAKANYAKAIGLQEKLVVELPDVPVHWEELIDSNADLANLLLAIEPVQEFEKRCRQLVELQKKQVAAFPRELAYQSGLAATLHDLARVFIHRSKLAEAATTVREAITFQLLVHKSNPQDDGNRRTVCAYYLTLVDVHVQLDDHAQAAQATADLLQLAPPAWPEYPRAARLLAQCLTLVAKDARLAESQRRDLAQKYGDQAMDLLRRALGQGYKDITVLKKAAEFEPLRTREDFRKLLADLEAKSQAGTR